LVGVAVKVAPVVMQEAPGELLIVTDGRMLVAVNESVMVLLVAVDGLTHDALLVITQ
jgi:hypothetical protein